MLKASFIKLISRQLLVLAGALYGSAMFAQQGYQLQGSFSAHANQSVILTGFNGLQAYQLDSVRASANGAFVLKYPTTYHGMAIVSAGPQQSHVLVLEPGGVQLLGSALADKATLVVQRGIENLRFNQYAVEHNKREQALSAWDYLQTMYVQDSLFRTQAGLAASIRQEVQRIKAEDSSFLAALPANSYVKWYLPNRALVSSAQMLAQYRVAEVPAATAAFRAIDFSDPRWQTSGIMREAIEKHVWLIENSAGQLDAVYASLNQSTDQLISRLRQHPAVLNTVTDYLFDYLEERSLFGAAEYLALRVLNDNACEMNEKVGSKLESYRKMKKGSLAPDIAFGPFTLAPSGGSPKKLSDIRDPYTLVVFAAGWCPHCTGMAPELAAKYAAWKQLGIEVVLVSLDETESAFAAFAGSLPFIRTTDYKKWEGTAAKNYHVYATPTMFLLNAKREILLKPVSVAQLDAWVDWYLVKGNK